MEEKNIAELLWEMFDELLDVVIVAISESGLIDIQFFKNPRNTNIWRIYLRCHFWEINCWKKIMQPECAKWND